MPLTEAEYEALEAFESESESAERARFRKPSAAPSFKPRPAPSTPMYVTQPQLEAALGRVDGKIKTVTESTTAINTRLTALSASIKKEAEERKKMAEGQGKDLNQKLQLLALLPVLAQPPSSKLAAGTLKDVNNRDILAVSTPSDTFSSILPVLLVSGIGGTGGPSLSGGSDYGTDGSLLTLALVLAFAGRPSS